MGKKKGKGPAKAGGAAAAPVAATREELIAAALAPLSQTVSEEELEVAREVVLDELPKLRSAQSLSEALSSTLDDVGVDAGEHLEDITALMRKFRLGLANPIVTVDTTAGSFKCELFLDTMPVSASNFLDLVGTGFYDGLHVHRIVPEFMVQLGCPNTADPKTTTAGEGAPAPGSKFTVKGVDGIDLDPPRVVVRGVDGDEAGCIPDEHTEKISNSIGTLAMANNDAPNTGGSQFFINLSDNPELDWWTPGDSKHPVFGKVVGDGIDVVAKIGKVPTDEDERPSKPIKIKRIALD